MGGWVGLPDGGKGGPASLDGFEGFDVLFLLFLLLFFLLLLLRWWGERVFKCHAFACLLVWCGVGGWGGWVGRSVFADLLSQLTAMSVV